MLSLIKNRPEVALFVLAGAGLLMIAAALPWLHLIGMPEPVSSKVLRVVCFLLALLTLSTLLRPHAGASVLIGVGGVTMLLPFLMLLWIGTHDPKTMDEAAGQESNADRLIKSIMFSDINPQIPWADQRRWTLYPEKRNDYTFVDSLEIVADFVKGGWYASFLGGVLLFAGSWIWDGRQARRTLVRHRLGIGASAAAVGLVLYGGQAVAQVYFHQAREAATDGRFTEALGKYHKVAQFDPRFDYDLAFHYEVGRLYRNLGMTSEPDYWATVGDANIGFMQPDDAVKVYRMHVPNPQQNPAILSRYANALLSSGGTDAQMNRDGAAITKFQEAIQLDPNNVQLMYGLAMEYTTIGNYAVAIPWWQKLIDANESINLYKHKYFISHVYLKPITARAWGRMGYCYKQMGQDEQAMQCYNASVKQGGGDDGGGGDG